jgi:hypothetical protein
MKTLTTSINYVMTFNYVYTLMNNYKKYECSTASNPLVMASNNGNEAFRNKADATLATFQLPGERKTNEYFTNSYRFNIN